MEACPKSHALSFGANRAVSYDVDALITLRKAHEENKPTTWDGEGGLMARCVCRRGDSAYGKVRVQARGQCILICFCQLHPATASNSSRGLSVFQTHDAGSLGLSHCTVSSCLLR